MGGVGSKQGSWALRNEPGRFMGVWVEPDPEIYKGVNPISSHFLKCFSLFIPFLTGPSLLSLLFIACWVGMKIPMNLHLLRWEPRWQARWLAGQSGGATAPERKTLIFLKKVRLSQPFSYPLLVSNLKFLKYEP